MPLVAATLAAELIDMDLYATEPEATAAWAAAYRVYFEDASSMSIPIVPAALVPAEPAMVGGLSGMSAASAAAGAIQAGILAFWGGIVAATAWPTVTAITPPPLLTGLGAALTSIFEANKSGSLSEAAAMTAIATSIHTNSLGGIAVWPPTPGGPGPQPIL